MTAHAAPVSRDDIARAADRLGAHIRRTPTFEVRGSDLGLVDPSQALTLKLEHLQHSGSFKGRGALNALLTSDPAPDGVVAASGGNHGIAVAWAARETHQKANIFVPEVAASAKVERLVQLGAAVHQTGALYSDALAAAEAFAASRDVATVHAYDQFEVMAGAGTVGLEIDAQVPEVETIVVACGGGGLAGGIASWFGPAVRLVVAETEGTPTYAEARRQGGPVDVDITGVGADALGARRLGALGWQALSSIDAESVLVSDASVEESRAHLWDRCRLRVEPAAAAAVAAARVASASADLGRTCIVVCGANVGP